MKHLFTRHTFRFIDHSFSSMLDQFAIDDTLTELVGQKKSIDTIRYWVVNDTIALGIQDQKLPFLQDGIAYLKQEGYDAFFRPSGGLAVVLDAGIINLSLILPEKEYHVTIDNGFLAMVALVKMWLAPYVQNMDVKEITESYCPGKYDVSVGGKKFAGLSQRRVKGGVGIFIYIAVERSGKKRAELIRTFYETSIQQEKTTIPYPNVNPNVMASVSELTGQPITCDMLKQELIHMLSRGQNTLDTRFLSAEEWALFETYKQRMKQRQQRYFPSLIKRSE